MPALYTLHTLTQQLPSTYHRQEKRGGKKKESKRSAARSEVIAEAMARSGGSLAASEVAVRCGPLTGRYLVAEGVVVGTSETVRACAAGLIASVRFFHCCCTRP